MSRYYKVERILDKKFKEGGVKYKVKWAGWPLEDATWEPLESLTNCINLVNDYETNSMKNAESFKSSEKENFVSTNEIEDINTIRKKPCLIIDNTSQSDSIGKTTQNEEEISNNEELEEDELEVIKVPGRLECDVPCKIISAKLLNKNEVICLIEWKKRYDGSIPIPSYATNKELRVKYPKLLLDYYETKIKLNKK